MRKFLWLMPALLLAGCRSEQVVFQFQPAPVGLAVSGGVGAASKPAAAAPPSAAAVVVAHNAPLRPAAAPRRPALVARLARAAVVPTTLVAPPRRLGRHLARRHATEGAAENGLAGIALFFIGVVLAVVAGLGALVNVIFGVGFLTGVGYAAAGLVVLALLYSLLSGGKKKK